MTDPTEIEKIIVGVNALGITFAVLALQNHWEFRSEIATGSPRKSRTGEAANEKKRRVIDAFLHMGTLFIFSSLFILWNIFSNFLGYKFPDGIAPVFTAFAYAWLFTAYLVFNYRRFRDDGRRRKARRRALEVFLDDDG